MNSPTNLKIASSAAGNLLTWDPVIDPSFAGYKVYRSLKDAVDPAAFIGIGVTGKPTHLDNLAPAGVVSYYRVSAFDAAQKFTGHADGAATRPGTPAPPAPPPASPRFGLPYDPRPAGFAGASLSPKTPTGKRSCAIGQDLKAICAGMPAGTLVLLQRGGKFSLKASGLTLGVDDIQFNAYGEGPSPIIELDILKGGSSKDDKLPMAGIALPKGRRGLFVQNIDFSAIERGFTDYTAVAIGAGASNATAAHCNALTPVLDTIFKSYGDATRAYWCDAPNAVNQYGVFFGDGATNGEMEACFINDSKDESGYRAYGENIRIVGNHLVKRRRAAGGVKCFIRNQYGKNHYIAGNLCESPDGQGQIILFPIGTDGTHSSAEQSVNFVFENNHCSGIAQFQLNYGGIGFLIRKNLLTWHDPAHGGIEVTSWKDAPTRLPPTGTISDNQLTAGSFISKATSGISYKGKGNTLNGAAVN